MAVDDHRVMCSDSTLGPFWVDLCGTSIARSFLGDADDFVELGFMEQILWNTTRTLLELVMWEELISLELEA